MIAYKCDRCGRYFDLIPNPNKGEKPYVNTFIRIYGRNSVGGVGIAETRKEIDLCEHCTRELYSFFDNVSTECEVNDD